MRSTILLLARTYLRLCGSRYPAEVLLDVREELERRRTAGLGALRAFVWALRQVAVVGLYELRDWYRLPRQVRPGLAFALSVRSIWRRPAVPLVAATTLGLGFGAAAAIYGTYAGFNRPLPLPDGDGVRWVRLLDDRGRAVSIDGEDLRLVADLPEAFDQVGAMQTASLSLRSRLGYPVRVPSAALTPELFELLGAAPALGRLPALGEEDVVVLGHEIWRDHFESDPAVIGQEVRVDGVPRPIVGVMPPGHEFPFSERVWTSLSPTAETSGMEIVGRLGAGVEVQGVADAISSRLHARRLARDDTASSLRVEVPPFTEKRGEGGENLILATLLVLVVALVLVSCSNVSNLLLARALGRVDLLAVHAAIGAGPAQVFVQMLTEALLISLAGAVVGLGLSAAAINYIQSTLSGHWGYYWMRVQFEPAVVLFTLGLAVVAGTVAGLLPAVRLFRTDLSDVLRAGSAAVAGSGRGRLSAGLLNVQVAVSALALIIASLMGGALLRSRPAPELRADDVFILSVFLDGARYEESEDRRTFRDAVAAGVAARGEVSEVAWANVVPGLANSFERFEIEGVDRDPDTRPVGAPVIVADAGYFEIFDVRPVAGEGLDGFSGTDELVAVVNSSFVEAHFAGRPPLEQRLRLQRTGNERWARIVGVVADLPAYRGEDARSRARIYVPFEAVEPRSFHVLFTGTDDATQAVHAELSSIEPDLGVSPLFGLGGQTRVSDVVAFISRIYQTGGLLAVLGGVSTALVALIGLYGALAFEVQRRLAEIGVRKALGADRNSVLRFVCRTGLRGVAPGLLLGLLMSAGFSPLLGVFLGRMNARDPFVYSGVFLAFVAVAAAATLVPGMRAARVDPVEVLRAD
ncbi:MAG: FtsX-like permease family protein [Acidobacteria bacterium]|nr:FtsX-like permease family protein [Acidobacteriota bacterium]